MALLNSCLPKGGMFGERIDGVRGVAGVMEQICVHCFKCGRNGGRASLQSGGVCSFVSFSQFYKMFFFFFFKLVGHHLNPDTMIQTLNQQSILLHALISSSRVVSSCLQIANSTASGSRGNVALNRFQGSHR